MKKNIITIGFCLASSFIFAQNLTDGLRYSMEGLNGTSRFNAMSGAFSSLGGDLSAVALNPAGTSIFTRSEMSLTLAGVNSKNDANGRSTISSDFLLSQFGVAFPITIGEEGWKNIAFAFNYQKTHNFDANDLNYTYRNNGANLGDFFLDKANGIMQQDLMLDVYKNKRKVGRDNLYELYSRMGKLKEPEKFRNALLGYTTGLVNPASGKRELIPSMSDSEADAVLEERKYKKNISDGITTIQNVEQYTEGGVNKYNFNFAGRYDFISFGINLNSHSVDYRVVNKYRENYVNNTASDIRSALYQSEVRTVGSGFSLQLGAIAEVATGLRIGLTYASPTWYTLQDEMSQSLSTTTQSNGTFFANPNVVAVYEKYYFRTPGSWTVGASWVWNKQLILSADYMYKGYGNMRFRSGLESENAIIQNTLGDTNSLRFGAEYRLPLSKTNHLFFRGGYRYEQSPYKTEYKPIGDLTGFSTGLGVSFGSMRFDLSYDRATRAYHPQIFESVLTDTPQVDNTLQNILLSFSLKL
ncbi:outer membrane protein transport protein [uncultured Capnocytophaga sp.]|uniref:OmpP1/FadL family transporter n=1 Tax=uncultured Capnocytophaga sp. TaxID=159273 RepID=UPI0026232FA9|nr:outer membrane protein transport protein [uncultured Capnocytophaga sp.]